MTSTLCSCAATPSGDRQSAAHLAHEVRALVGSVAGALELLLQDGTSRMGQRVLRMLQAQAAALLALVEATPKENESLAAPALRPVQGQGGDMAASRAASGRRRTSWWIGAARM